MVPIKSVALGLTRKYDSVYRQFRHHQTPKIDHDVENPRSSTSPLYPLSEDDSFNPVHLVQLQSRFYSARNIWTRQAEKLKHLFVQCKSMVSSSNSRNLSPAKQTMPQIQSNYPLPKEIFDAILLTIIGETNEDRDIAIDNLLLIFDEYPSELEFFIPQIAFFLLYGAFELEDKLKRKLLIMCEKNLTFAYKLYWFIHAFCLNYYESNRSNRHRNRKFNSSRLNYRKASPSSVSKTMPLFRMDSESFDVLDQFQENIREAGEKAHDAFIHRMQAIQPPISSSSIASTATTISNLSSGRVNEVLPLLSPQRKFCHFHRSITTHLPLHLTKPANPANSTNSANPSFDLQLNFWNSLISMTRELFLIPKNQRYLHMVEILKAINEEYLPSNIIHIPLGNSNHRIWKIHIEECFPFSTKERTPVLVCFEVLFHDIPDR